MKNILLKITIENNLFKTINKNQKTNIDQHQFIRTGLLLYQNLI